MAAKCPRRSRQDRTNAYGGERRSVQRRVVPLDARRISEGGQKADNRADDATSIEQPEAATA
jgi:hypothetical protein